MCIPPLESLLAGSFMSLLLLLLYDNDAVRKTFDIRSIYQKYIPYILFIHARKKKKKKKKKKTMAIICLLEITSSLFTQPENQLLLERESVLVN